MSAAKQKIYFMGIGGTGMASVAGLCKEAGSEVVGSDFNMYPPMSTMLDSLKVPVHTPYSIENVKNENPQLIIVGNAISRGHVELEYALANNIPYTSFPAFLGKEFLSKRASVVVAGTHGKTTTTTLMAHVLTFLGQKPGFMIGGIAKNFAQSFASGEGEAFVVEGDEYDTAFFDKGPKFLHYCPRFLIINNIEFDHADIYQDVDAIKTQFIKLAELVPENGGVIFNSDDQHVCDVITRAQLKAKSYPVATTGRDKNAVTKITSCHGRELERGKQIWDIAISSAYFGDFILHTGLGGTHNAANLAQVFTCLQAMVDKNVIKTKILAADLQGAIDQFQGVQRRLEYLGGSKTVDIYEDFAHHPTAVDLVIKNFKAVHPHRRLIIAFEPKNATSRRNTFMAEYVKVFSQADGIYIGPTPVDKKIPDEKKMNIASLAKTVGPKAHSFDSNEDLLNQLEQDLKPYDAVIFMSPGSFSGIHHALVKKLKNMNL